MISESISVILNDQSSFGFEQGFIIDIHEEETNPYFSIRSVAGNFSTRVRKRFGRLLDPNSPDISYIKIKVRDDPHVYCYGPSRIEYVNDETIEEMVFWINDPDLIDFYKEIAS